MRRTPAILALVMTILIGSTACSRQLTGTAVLESVTRKKLSIGDGAFMVIGTTYANQDGETVARDELTVFRLDDEVDA